MSGQTFTFKELAACAEREVRMRREVFPRRVSSGKMTASLAQSETENLIPLLVDCARAYCTEGEIVGALRDVFGEYTETPRF